MYWLFVTNGIEQLIAWPSHELNIFWPCHPGSNLLVFSVRIYFFSLASLSAICSNSSEILKFVSLILSKYGLSEGIIQAFFALIITPKVPVTSIPNRSAIFLAFQSSRIKILSTVSSANAIALASPLSIWTSSNCCLYWSFAWIIKQLVELKWLL